MPQNVSRACITTSYHTFDQWEPKTTCHRKHLLDKNVTLPGGGGPDANIKEGLEGALLLVHFVHVVRASVRLALDNLCSGNSDQAQPESKQLGADDGRLVKYMPMPVHGLTCPHLCERSKASKRCCKNRGLTVKPLPRALHDNPELLDESVSAVS